MGSMMKPKKTEITEKLRTEINKVRSACRGPTLSPSLRRPCANLPPSSYPHAMLRLASAAS
jgi:hypothetical protein